MKLPWKRNDTSTCGNNRGDSRIRLTFETVSNSKSSAASSCPVMHAVTKIYGFGFANISPLDISPPSGSSLHEEREPATRLYAFILHVALKVVVSIQI